jgi:transcriptional regulator with XRE-family HTH domain
MTPAQCREARVLLGTSQLALAAASQVSRSTIITFESTARNMGRNNLAAVQRAHEDAGVEFLAEHRVRGVKLRRAK